MKRIKKPLRHIAAMAVMVVSWAALPLSVDAAAPTVMHDDAGELIIAAIEQFAQRRRAADNRLGMMFEKIEEALFLRHKRLKPRQHFTPPLMSPNRHV